MGRILCVTAMYPPHHQGGYEVSCRDVMTRLAARGHDVEVLTSNWRIPGVDDGPEPVHRDLTLYYQEDIWAPGVWGRWRIERHNRRVTRAALEKYKPDVVTVWHIGALSLGVVGEVIDARLPIVYGISDDWLLYSPLLDRWLTVMRRLGPLARPLGPIVGVATTPPDLGPSGVFCFISEATRQRAIDASRWSFPLTAIVYSGIDRTLFTPRRHKKHDEKWAGRLLYVGRYDPRKGIETVIRAMAQLPGWTLEVQGTGDDAYRQTLETLSRELDVADRVEFQRVSRAELPARYQAADAFIFPSEWVEPFGLVPLEAMACGTPVVATTMGGSGEFLLDERNCLVFEPGDAAGLAAAVRRLAEQPDLRARLVDQGYATAEYFDVEHLADAYEAWLLAAPGGFAERPPSRHFALDAKVPDG